MSKVIVLQHVSHEGPGRLGTMLRDYGIQVEVRRLYSGDEVPTDLDGIRMLIVMGGPMGVADIGSEKYPFLAKEVELLQRCIAHDRTTLGICLGAQLIAHAAGAKVYPNVKPGTKPGEAPIPMPEFGWLPVTFPFPGGTEPIVMGLTDGVMMFHWHFDTFDLPKLPPPANAPPPPAPPPPSGNSLLSSSKACKNQAFRFKNRLFGFQYHFELTQTDIEKILVASWEDAAKALGEGGERQIRQDTGRYYARYARMGEKIIGNIVQFLKVY